MTKAKLYEKSSNFLFLAFGFKGNSFPFEKKGERQPFSSKEKHFSEGYHGKQPKLKLLARQGGRFPSSTVFPMSWIPQAGCLTWPAGSVNTALSNLIRPTLTARLSKGKSTQSCRQGGWDRERSCLNALSHSKSHCSP